LTKVLPARTPGDALAHTYGQLAAALLGTTVRICVFDGALAMLGCSEGLDAQALGKWLQEAGWPHKARNPIARVTYQGRQLLTAIPLLNCDESLLGALVVQQTPQRATQPLATDVRNLVQKLTPCIECLHRELAAAVPANERLQNMTERTAELEWLFKITNGIKAASSNRHVIEELLAAATTRLRSKVGVLHIPEKHLTLRAGVKTGPLSEAWEQSQAHLMTWALRQRKPLVVNSAGRGGKQLTPCKMMSVPIQRDSGQVIGIMAFFNSPDAADFGARHSFLGRHVGRQMASIVEAHFDLITGLYTRDGLEQIYGQLLEQSSPAERSVIYVDIDHLRVVNETHGFELGNELIVRIAELVSPPFVPAGAFAGRVAGDRFVVVLPECDPRGAAQVAKKAQSAACALRIGPQGDPIEVSISCGIAALVDMPQGLARAIAAAEIACKTAKSRGRNRTELYACEDSSMMRRQDDVVAIGQLRSALKSDGFMLYAQRIVPLQNPELPGSYEILLRMRSPDGDIQSPGPLIGAATGYQLLPAIDRWVTGHALRQLAPYRSTIRSRGITFALNVSGQSIADEAFIHQLAEQLRGATLPRGSITIEITEQAAVTNLARANDMLQKLRALGCQFALDDFGTGANSLTILKALQIGRVKIEGNFIRDIVSNSRSQATVRSIIELAKGLSLETVAEYVETEEIANAVRKLGVDYAQGYFYSMPEPLEKVLTELAQDESRRMRRMYMEI